MKLAGWLFGACLCIAPVMGRAQQHSPIPNPTPEQADALAAFGEAQEGLVDTFSHADTPPSMDDPVYAAQVAQAFDVAIIAKEPMPFLAGVCNGAAATQATYIIRGARKEDMDPFAIQPRLKSEPNARIEKLKSENYQRFQNELVPALGFVLACRTRELEALNTYLQQMSKDEMVVFRLGFADFQDSLAETVTYHAEALRGPIRPQNRQAVLDLLVQNIDPLAAGMSKSSRRQVAAVVARAMAGKGVAPKERAALQKISLALKRKDCGPVCAFH